MAADYAMEQVAWRQGRTIEGLSLEQIQTMITDSFKSLRNELIWELEEEDEDYEGYSGTLAEKDGVFISYFSFLTDEELARLYVWISDFKNQIFNWRRVYASAIDKTPENTPERIWHSLMDGHNFWENKNFDKQILMTLGSIYTGPWQRNNQSSLPYAIKNRFQDGCWKEEREWERSLQPEDAELWKKLRQNDYNMRRLLFSALLCRDKAEPAVGIANNNVAYFFGMCSS